jgi:arylsulfatase A-like enzyme
MNPGILMHKLFSNQRTPNAGSELRCLIVFAMWAWVISWLAPCTFGDDAQPAKSLPNIVLCMADDQGWGDVGYYHQSPVKTPVLDEMAATSLRFDRFYAAHPVCSPTRGSVLTGRHPNRYGCFSWGHTIRPQEITIAEALKQAGYATGHFGKWHVGPVVADHSVNPGNSGFDRWVSAPNFFDNDSLLSDQGKIIINHGESSAFTMDHALTFMRKCHQQQQPFLAVIWFGSPHGPHIASDELRALYADQPAKLQNFLGELSGIDAAMGKLQDELRELKIAENTLVWYTSDNGALPQGSTAGLSGRKSDLNEGGIRVPAIIQWPARIKSARVVETPCSTVDIYPTLLAIAGVEIEQQPVLDGQDLLPIIDGGTIARVKPLGFWVHPTPGISTPSDKILAAMADAEKIGIQFDCQVPDPANITQQYSTEEFPGAAALIDGDYKLHKRWNKKSNEFHFELFNLQQDPPEKHDIAAEQPDRVDRMKQQLNDWQESVVHSLNGDDYVK